MVVMLSLSLAEKGEGGGGEGYKLRMLQSCAGYDAARSDFDLIW